MNTELTQLNALGAYNEAMALWLTKDFTARVQAGDKFEQLVWETPIEGESRIHHDAAAMLLLIASKHAGSATSVRLGEIVLKNTKEGDSLKVSAQQIIDKVSKSDLPVNFPGERVDVRKGPHVVVHTPVHTLA
jgi:hypothetical protein